ncbi:MAG: LLM class flavin-dependent oxidoreductase [Proteobacteria bacterium]|nr:LLM class flavin-dependent oxidoreductase [Pseudomonadota bacterium]
MRFGVMHDFRNPQRWHVPSPRFYESMIEQVVAMERMGYDHVWLTEHHFTEDAYNPVPLAMACALAARTKTIRIGTFVMLMPFIHPLRAAEEVVLADILSNGRFDLGVGQGYTHEEFDAFCQKRGERGALGEGVTLMKKLLTEENVSFDGRFTQVKNATLMPRPVQQPVPIWIGARGPKAIRRAAALGANFMTTFGPDPVPEYMAALKELGRDPSPNSKWRNCAWSTSPTVTMRPGKRPSTTCGTCSITTAACCRLPPTWKATRHSPTGR